MSAVLDTETIAAIATPSGSGGVGIIRLSGPGALSIGQSISKITLSARHAHLTSFLDANDQPLDSGLILFFPGPNSFTGEDVIELQGHGGEVVMQMLLARCLELGARAARAGEFSERAFLNDKIDLAQAEAIADLIASGSETAVKAAQRSLSGEFSGRVNLLKERVISLRVYVEAAIDFPDEEIDFLADGQVLSRLQMLSEELNQLLDTAQSGQVLRDGLAIALVGRPNAGKSSLLNALCRSDIAIVTDIPGTTRDVLRERVNLEGIPLNLVDTAGLRETNDPVEREGVRRARLALEQADCALWVIDVMNDPQSEQIPEIADRTVLIEVHNKIDLIGETPEIEPLSAHHFRIKLSTKTGEGLDLLRQKIKQIAGHETAKEGQFLARTRHLDALKRVQECLLQGEENLTIHQAGELLAEELRIAQQHLSEITGAFSSDDLLGEIFSSFCIGK